MMALLMKFRIHAYVGAAALAVGFALGFHLEAQRFAEFRGGVEAIGEAAEKDAQRRNATRKRITKETNDAYRRKTAALNASLAAVRSELQQHASRSVLSEPGAPTGRSDFVQPATICFDREKLDAGLRGSVQRFAERSAEIVQRGAVGDASFHACADWALKQHEAK